MASLIGAFVASSFAGKAVVLAQLAALAAAVAFACAKRVELSGVARGGRRFLRDFLAGRDVLDYYLLREGGSEAPLEAIYARTCERLVKLLDPETRRAVIGREPGAQGAALTAREIGLVRGTCRHALREESLRLERGLDVLAGLAAAAPALGLAGTLWGLSDLFAELGARETVAAPAVLAAVSAALVSVVLGLLAALAVWGLRTGLSRAVRRLTVEMEGFADELVGRVAYEFQGRVE